MSFQSRFEEGERINVSDLGWKGVPVPGSGAAESSTPRGGETGRRDRHLNGGRRSKGWEGMATWRRASGYGGARL